MKTFKNIWKCSTRWKQTAWKHSKLRLKRLHFDKCSAVDSWNNLLCWVGTGCSQWNELQSEQSFTCDHKAICSLWKAALGTNWWTLSLRWLLSACWEQACMPHSIVKSPKTRTQTHTHTHTHIHARTHANTPRQTDTGRQTDTQTDRRTHTRREFKSNIYLFIYLFSLLYLIWLTLLWCSFEIVILIHFQFLIIVMMLMMMICRARTN